MSTCYRFTEAFSKEQVVNAVKKLGLMLPDLGDCDETQFFIATGDCGVWAYHNKDGSNVSFCRYGANYNAEDYILEPLAIELQTELISEHDEEYFEEDEEEQP